MTADQEDDSIPLSYAEAKGSGRVVCCSAGVSLWGTERTGPSVCRWFSSHQTWGLSLDMAERVEKLFLHVEKPTLPGGGLRTRFFRFLDRDIRVQSPKRVPGRPVDPELTTTMIFGLIVSFCCGN